MRRTVGGLLAALSLSLLPGSTAATTGPAAPCPMFRGACDPPALDMIHMIDGQRGWALTHGLQPNVLLRTTDGGVHWTDLTPPGAPGVRQGISVLHALTSRIAWVGWSNPDIPPHGGVGSFHTTDGGRTWRPGAVPSDDQNPVLSISSIHFINPLEGWLLGSGGAAMGRVEAFIYRSTDGGETWVEISGAGHMREDSGLSFAGAKSGISFVSPTTGWVTGGDGRVTNWLFLYMTRDGGRTWRMQDLPKPGGTPEAFVWTRPPRFFTSRHGLLPVVFDLESSPERVIVFYATRDGGMTWIPTKPVSVTQQRGGWESVYAFADMDNGWVSDGMSLSVTRDGGRSWVEIRPGGSFTDVKQLDFTSPRQGWAVSKLWPYLVKTVDGGRTWTAVTYTVSRP